MLVDGRLRVRKDRKVPKALKVCRDPLTAHKAFRVPKACKVCRDPLTVLRVNQVHQVPRGLLAYKAQPVGLALKARKGLSGQARRVRKVLPANKVYRGSKVTRGSKGYKVLLTVPRVFRERLVYRVRRGIKV